MTTGETNWLYKLLHIFTTLRKSFGTGREQLIDNHDQCNKLVTTDVLWRLFVSFLFTVLQVDKLKMNYSKCKLCFEDLKVIIPASATRYAQCSDRKLCPFFCSEDSLHVYHQWLQHARRQIKRRWRVTFLSTHGGANYEVFRSKRNPFMLIPSLKMWLTCHSNHLRRQQLKWKLLLAIIITKGKYNKRAWKPMSEWMNNDKNSSGFFLTVTDSLSLAYSLSYTLLGHPGKLEVNWTNKRWLHIGRYCPSGTWRKVGIHLPLSLVPCKLIRFVRPTWLPEHRRIRSIYR